MKLVYTLGLGYIAVCAWVQLRGAIPSPGNPVSAVTPAAPGDNADVWFQQVKAFCNPVEVDTHLAWYPPPPGWEGVGYAAACYGLAGNTARARELITELKGDERWRAVGIVFNVGHPVADAGNNVAAGPIMELVVEFWPNHYMALYHAGIASYELERPGVARKYLEQFLSYYEVEDGFRHNATEILSRLRGP